VSTAVVEHLNVLDVVTADRVVAQIATEHPLIGYVPHISFLGTRFENLRIAGHKVDIDLDLLGTEADKRSPSDGNKGFMERIEARNQEFNYDPEWFPDWYDEFEEFFDPLRALPNEDEGVDPERPDVVTRGSLVKTSNIPLPESQEKDRYPGECFGKVIKVPGFGTIHLATVHIKHSKFTIKEGEPKKTEVNLSMVKLKMGCIAAGKMAIANSRVNAGSHP
jgi:hypothetical protein